ncbi:hypothetical protein AB0M43_38570 [Longispora sp. NPDC051575]|uniref:hypothetical protein n=1 Tax=Longispora sp. NPDC051575 TaxID=3154943 RepID=UPI00341A4BA0
MTRRTIRFAPDVDARLDQLDAGQVSAYVTEAVRDRITRERTLAALAEAGYHPDPQKAAAAAAMLARRPSRALRDAAVSRLADLTGLSAGALRDDLGLGE